MSKVGFASGFAFGYDPTGHLVVLDYKIDRIPYSMFDPPEADKCLLAFGELDVRCLPALIGG